MSRRLLLPLLLLLCNAISAQLTISNDALLHVSGAAQLTLHNTSMVNNGNFSAGNSLVRFTGNSPASIGGSRPVQFFEVEINKQDNKSVFLSRSISVTHHVIFLSGFLGLNGSNLDLGSTAHLYGESEHTGILAGSGGKVIASAILNAPSGINPGNLGIIITSPQNLGNVIIQRGHQPQVPGAGNTILRYYDITPANNNMLNATLRFHYLDSELFGTDENTIVFVKSSDMIHWSNEGSTSRNTTANYVEKTGINSFARWTLARPNFALPVQFVSLNVKCEAKQAIVSWKTAREQQSSHFDIEGSQDGASWSIIGTVRAAGNSTIERNYSFIDHTPSQSSYYRIAQYDLDGSVQYSSIIRSGCVATEEFGVWPNPVRDKAYLNITLDKASLLMVKVYDSKGMVVKVQQAALSEGNNQVIVGMQSLASGTYLLSAENNTRVYTVKLYVRR